MFSIEFTDEAVEYPYDDANIPAAPGRLLLGSSKEEFLANISLWNKAAYESHWKQELEALLNGSPKVALVVSYDDPAFSMNIEIWRAYRAGDWVHFQNQILSYRSLPEKFDIAKISEYIGERVELTEEGNRISEWNVAIQEISAFIQK